MRTTTLRNAAVLLAGLAVSVFLLWDYARNRGQHITYVVFRLDERVEWLHRFPVTNPGEPHVVSARTPRGESVVELILRDPDGREIRSRRDAVPRATRRLEFTPLRADSYVIVIRDRTAAPSWGDRPLALSVSEGDESVLSRLTGRAAW